MVKQAGSYNRRRHTISEGVAFITAEARRTGVDHLVISSNLRLRKDGLPVSDQINPTDPGVAVYFTYQGKPTCFACDRWTRVEDNLWAIGLTIEAMRGIDRWGAADLEATFLGYSALPAPEGKMWYEVLGVEPNAPYDDVRTAYYAKAQQHHPDKGGRHEDFVEVKQAWEAYGAYLQLNQN